MQTTKHIYTVVEFSYGNDTTALPIEHNGSNENAIEYLTGLLGWLIDNDYCCDYSGGSLYWRDPDTDVRGSVTLV